MIPQISVLTFCSLLRTNLWRVRHALKHYAAHFGWVLFLASRLAICQSSESALNVELSGNGTQQAVIGHSDSPAVLTRGENDTGPVESEIVVEGMASYGNYKIFAAAENCKLYYAGIEYDRHSWGRFLRARVDYVAEILPVLLLNQPAVTSIWGGTESTKRITVPGIGISPIGFRMQWRDKRNWKPYMLAKGGMVGFTQKVLSNKATYESFSLETGVGLQMKMSERVDLRLGLFSDFHFSNAFIVPVDPGLDVMNANIGVSYHLGGTRKR